MGIFNKKVINEDILLTEEELAKYKARADVLSSEIIYLVNKPNKTKSDYNQLTIKSRKFKDIVNRLKKARKEALKYEKSK